MKRTKMLIEELTYATPVVKGADQNQITEMILLPAENHIKEFIVRKSVLLNSGQCKFQNDLLCRLNPVDYSWIDDNMGEYPLKFKLLEKQNDHMLSRMVLPFIVDGDGSKVTTKRNEEYDGEGLIVCVVRRDDSAECPKFMTNIKWVEGSGGLIGILTIRMTRILRGSFQIGWRGL